MLSFCITREPCFSELMDDLVGSAQNEAVSFRSFAGEEPALSIPLRGGGLCVGAAVIGVLLVPHLVDGEADGDGPLRIDEVAHFGDAVGDTGPTPGCWLVRGEAIDTLSHHGRTAYGADKKNVVDKIWQEYSHHHYGNYSLITSTSITLSLCRAILSEINLGHTLAFSHVECIHPFVHSLSQTRNPAQDITVIWDAHGHSLPQRWATPSGGGSPVQGQPTVVQVARGPPPPQDDSRSKRNAMRHTRTHIRARVKGITMVRTTLPL